MDGKQQQQRITRELKTAINQLKEPSVEVWASPGNAQIIWIDMGRLFNLSFSCQYQTPLTPKAKVSQIKFGQIDSRLEKIISFFRKKYPSFEFLGY